MLKKWNNEDKKKWFNEQKIQRSYKDEVVSKLNACTKDFNITTYASLLVDDKKYEF